MADNERCAHLETEVRHLANTIALCYFFTRDKKRAELRETVEEAYDYVCRNGYFTLDEERI